MSVTNDFTCQELLLEVGLNRSLSDGLGLLNSTDPWESLELKHRPRGENTSLGAGVSLYCAVGRVTGCLSGVSPNWCGSYLRPWVA